jgi:hypothetical protein
MVLPEDVSPFMLDPEQSAVLTHTSIFFHSARDLVRDPGKYDLNQ